MPPYTTLQAYIDTGEWFDLDISARASLAEKTFRCVLLDPNGHALLDYTEPSHTSTYADEDGSHGPDGEYGLARDANNYSILPSLSFSDLWFSLSIPQRLHLTSSADGSNFAELKAGLTNTLNHFDGEGRERLVRLLKRAPSDVFPTYITLASSGQCLPRSKARDLAVFDAWDWEWQNVDHENGYFCDQSWGEQGNCYIWHENPPRPTHHRVQDLPIYTCQHSTPCPCDPAWQTLTYEPADEELNRRIEPPKFPRELFNLVKEMFLWHVLAKSGLVMDTPTLTNGLLRRLLWRTNLKAENEFVQTALWTLPHGSIDYSQFFDPRVMPREIVSGLRKLSISLSLKDACVVCLSHLDDFANPLFYKNGNGNGNLASWLQRRSPADSDMESLNGDYDWDIIEILGVYDYCIRSCIEDLKRLWVARLEWAMGKQQQLDFLRVDMRDCVSPHGRFLGLEVAQAVCSSLFVDEGVEVELLAPTENDARAIRGILTGR